ncbi:MAG TPA: terminase family protein, partial [Ilumatobacteraceae bacterium]
AEVLRASENWSPGARAQALDAVLDILEGRRRAWFCDRRPVWIGTEYVSGCDGKPHGRFAYNHARGDQWPPPDPNWLVWFLSGGRGSGKTRTGSEYTRKMSERVGRMALIAPTGADVRDTMIEGESGLLKVASLAGISLKYEPSKRRLTFPNGCIATTFSAEEPDRLRGPQHGYAWLDEPAHMPLIDEVWSNLMFGLRLGDRPQVTLTTTPLPTKWVKERAKDPMTRLVRVSTRANMHNLAAAYQEVVIKRYEGTRLGKQELDGMILQDVEGALWNGDILHRADDIDPETMDRIIIAIDPAGSANRRSDETGIVVAGIRGDNGYVFEDASGKYSPNGWAERALKLYEKYNADAIIAEKNYGGDMVRTVIERAVPKSMLPPRIIVTTAMKSKRLRAEPVVALYEQTRVFHTGNLADLEDEMLTWVPGQGDSPNRVDATVWALTELMKPGGELTMASPAGSFLSATRRYGGISRRRG